MAGNQGKGKGFLRGLLSGNSSRPTLLRGGLRDLQGEQGKNTRPDIVRPNVQLP